MGEANAEQTLLQEKLANEAAIAKAKRREIRKHNRAGHRGLAAHIATAA